MKTALKCLVFLLATLPLLNGCKPEATAPTIPTIEDDLRSEMKRLQLPSLTAVITRGNSVVWAFYGGTVSLSYPVAPNHKTEYVLASISKTVTAVAAMQLVERGRLDLDVDISNYTGFNIRNPHYPQTLITTRMLLSHSSGLAHPQAELPGFYHLYDSGEEPPLRTWLQNLIVPGGLNYMPAAWKQIPPGQSYQYSNIGAAVVGLIVESITGIDFSVYCETNIFLPIGMRQTSFRAQRTDPNIAAIYTSATNTRSHYSVPFYPSTTLRTTAEDFSKFMIVIYQGGIFNGIRILQDATISTMLTPSGVDGSLCYLWFAFGENERGHSGGFVGVSSFFEINPPTQSGFYIITNLGGVADVYPNGRIHTIIRDHAARLD